MKCKNARKNKETNMSKKQNPKKTNPSGGYKGPKGDEEDLGYHVFDYGKANNQNQFNKTLEAIISHIGRNYRQPGNIITSKRNKQEVIIPLVPTPKFQDESVKDDDKARLAKAANRAADLEYVEQIKARNREKETLKENVHAAYTWCGASARPPCRRNSRP